MISALHDTAAHWRGRAGLQRKSRRSVARACLEGSFLITWLNKMKGNLLNVIDVHVTDD